MVMKPMFYKAIWQCTIELSFKNVLSMHEGPFSLLGNVFTIRFNNFYKKS